MQIFPLSLLLVIALLLPTLTTCQLCNFESYFAIDLDIIIQPRRNNVTLCDVARSRTRLEKLIEYVIDRKFQVYVHNTEELSTAQIDKLCGRGDVIGRRDLQTLSLTTLGWSYSTTSKCRFCLGDFQDQFAPATLDPHTTHQPNTDISFVESPATSRVPSSEPSSVPSTAPSGPTGTPSNAPSIAPTISALEKLERALKRRLEKQLRRVLRRKINRGARSCLRGSGSDVNITLTAIGNQAPPTSAACPSQ